MHEHISVAMNSVFSGPDETEAVGHLSGDDAQTFIDLVYEVSLCTLSPLDSAETSVFRRLAYRWSRATDPTEMYALFARDLRSPSPAPKTAHRSAFSRPNRVPKVSRPARGRVDESMP